MWCGQANSADASASSSELNGAALSPELLVVVDLVELPRRLNGIGLVQLCDQNETWPLGSS